MPELVKAIKPRNRFVENRKELRNRFLGPDIKGSYERTLEMKDPRLHHVLAERLVAMELHKKVMDILRSPVSEQIKISLIKDKILNNLDVRTLFSKKHYSESETNQLLTYYSSILFNVLRTQGKIKEMPAFWRNYLRLINGITSPVISTSPVNQSTPVEKVSPVTKPTGKVYNPTYEEPTSAKLRVQLSEEEIKRRNQEAEPYFEEPSVDVNKEKEARQRFVDTLNKRVLQLKNNFYLELDDAVNNGFISSTFKTVVKSHFDQLIKENRFDTAEKYINRVKAYIANVRQKIGVKKYPVMDKKYSKEVIGKSPETSVKPDVPEDQRKPLVKYVAPKSQSVIKVESARTIEPVRPRRELTQDERNMRASSRWALEKYLDLRIKENLVDPLSGEQINDEFKSRILERFDDLELDDAQDLGENIRRSIEDLRSNKQLGTGTDSKPNLQLTHDASLAEQRQRFVDTLNARKNQLGLGQKSNTSNRSTERVYNPTYEEPTSAKLRVQLSEEEIKRRNQEAEPMFDDVTNRSLDRLRTSKKFTLPELQKIDDLVKRYSDIVDVNIELGITPKEKKVKMIAFVIENIEKQGTRYILSLQKLVETNEANFKKKLEEHRANNASRFAPAIVSEKDLLKDILRNNVTKDPAELDSFTTEAERATYIPPKKVSGVSSSFFDISLTRTIKVTSENNNQAISIEGSPITVKLLPGNTYVVTNKAILEIPREGLVKETSSSIAIPEAEGPIIQATLSVRNDNSVIVYRRIVNRREARDAKADRSVGITAKNTEARAQKEIKDAKAVFEEYEIDVGQDFSSNKKPIKYKEFLDLLRKVGAQNIVDLILEYEQLLRSEIPKGRMTEAEVIPTIYTDLTSLLKTARIDQIKTYIANARAEIQRRDNSDTVVARYTQHLDLMIKLGKMTQKKKAELLEALSRQTKRLGIEKITSMLERIIENDKERLSEKELAEAHERESERLEYTALANELENIRRNIDISDVKTAQDLASKLKLGQLKMDIEAVQKMLKDHALEMSSKEISKIEEQLFDAEELLYQLKRFEENISKFSPEETQELLFWLKFDVNRIDLGNYLDYIISGKKGMRPIPLFFEMIGGDRKDWELLNAYADEHQINGDQRVKFLIEWKDNTSKELRDFIEDYAPERVEPMPSPEPLKPLELPKVEYEDPELERIRQDNERRAQMLDLMERENAVRGAELVDIPRVNDLEYEKRTELEASEKLVKLKEQLVREAQEARTKRAEEYKKQEPIRQQIAQDYGVLQNIVRLVSALAPEKRKEYYQALDKILRDTKSSDLETNVNAHRYAIIAFRPFIEIALNRFNVMFSDYERAQTNNNSSQIEWTARILESIKPRLTQFTEYKDILPKLEKALTIKNNFVSLRRAKVLTRDLDALTTMDLRDVDSVYSLRSRYRFKQMDEAFLEFDKLWADLTLNAELNPKLSQELLDSIDYPRRYHTALKTIFDNPGLFNEKILDIIDILRYSLVKGTAKESKEIRVQMLEKMVSNVIVQSNRKLLPKPGDTTITKGSPEYMAMRSKSAIERYDAAMALQKDIEARELVRKTEQERIATQFETPEETIALNRIARRKARAERRAIDPRVQAENAKQGKKTGKKFKLTNEVVDGKQIAELDELQTEPRDPRQMQFDFDSDVNKKGPKILGADGKPVDKTNPNAQIIVPEVPKPSEVIIPEKVGKGQRSPEQEERLAKMGPDKNYVTLTKKDDITFFDKPLSEPIIETYDGLINPEFAQSREDRVVLEKLAKAANQDDLMGDVLDRIAEKYMFKENEHYKYKLGSAKLIQEEYTARLDVKKALDEFGTRIGDWRIGPGEELKMLIVNSEMLSLEQLTDLPWGLFVFKKDNRKLTILPRNKEDRIISIPESGRNGVFVGTNSAIYEYTSKVFGLGKTVKTNPTNLSDDKTIRVVILRRNNKLIIFLPNP